MEPSTVDAVLKLFGVVASGFGAVQLLAPWNKRRLARATADEMKILAQGKIDVDMIRLRGKAELDQLAESLVPSLPVEAEIVIEETPILLTRVRERFEYQEAKRQLNVEQVVAEAAKELQGEEVTTDPVDEDWVARFFESVRDVSSEQMQEIWARMLAGEVRRPGSFSLRCLETVRNLSKEEVVLFNRLGAYVFSGRYVLHGIEGFKASANFSFADALRLEDARLLTTGSGLTLTQTIDTEGSPTTNIVSDLAICVKSEQRRKVTFEVYALTAAGVELCQLSRQKADRNYVRGIVAVFRKHGCEVETYQGLPDGLGLRLLSREDLFPVEQPTASEHSASGSPVCADAEAPSTSSPTDSTSVATGK